MKLEELIRKTSKEENPAPNYQRLLREESKVDKFRRQKQELKVDKSFDRVERDIICNTVEEMIA